MPWWHRKLEELSKGMQQKVQFITTVLHEPPLLIFDEPFSGFDPVNAELLKREILELRDKGHTILFSTHNMASVEELCDSIALINHSKVVLQGTVETTRAQYKDDRLKRVTIPDSSPIPPDLKVVNSEISHGRRCLTVEEPAGETNSAFLTRIGQQTEILAFDELLPSMNDIFLRVVGKEQDQQLNTTEQ